MTKLSLQMCRGDVIASQFRGEKEIVLFVPGSGDVLLALESDWLDLKKANCGLPSDLNAKLVSLGAVID